MMYSQSRAVLPSGRWELIFRRQARGTIGRMRKEVERLVLQARRDLENARKNVGIEAYEVAAFFSHQAVEWHRKALWIRKRHAPPPATHYLRELGQGVGIPKRLAANLRFLNPDYTVARYPDAANGVPYELYDEPTARAKVKAAEEVARWAESLIRS
jgi:HEPN domain-containing protein